MQKITSNAINSSKDQNVQKSYDERQKFHKIAVTDADEEVALNSELRTPITHREKEFSSISQNSDKNMHHIVT